MGIIEKRAARVRVCAALVGVLLCGVSTNALAASAKKKVDTRDTQIQMLRQQLSDMAARLDALERQRQDDAAKVNEAQATAATAVQTATKADQTATETTTQISQIKTDTDSNTALITRVTNPPAGLVTVNNGRPVFATSDGRFSAQIRAIVMFDAGHYFQDDNLPAAVTARDLNSGTNFRRARFGAEGTLFKDFNYGLIYEFGGSGGEDNGHIQEAYLQYNGFKGWRVRLGAFEPNIGLAAAVSTSQMPIMERPSPAEIARNVAAGDSRSAIQVQRNGLIGAADTGIAARYFVSTAFTGNTVGTSNSTGSSTAQPTDEQMAWIGRAAIAPFSSTAWQGHLGVNYQYVFKPNDSGAAAPAARYPVQLRDRPELRLDGARLIDTGALDADHVKVFGTEAGLTTGPFMLEGEYFWYDVDRRPITGGQPTSAKFHGWYVQGAWVITGENRPYNPTEARFDQPRMNYNFNPSAGTWGAWELVGRYSDMDLNFHECGLGATAGKPACFSTVRGGEQKIYTAGVNWYLNNAIRFMFDYQHVDVDRLNAAGAQMGQSYNAVAMRTQFTY